MLREIVIEEEMPGDCQTTFRLRVDGNVIAQNVTELETQFLVSARTNSVAEDRCERRCRATLERLRRPAPPCRR
jgi:hypothetical protein